MNVVEFLSQLNGETEILLSLSIILFSGFILTRMTNTLNMPKVSGYILAGILIGPCCFNFIPAPVIDGMSFVSDLALSFIAFGVGKFFKKEVLMRTGKRIIIITISEALAAGVLVTLCLKFIFNLNWEFALILGAIATATAPASTMMTINQYKAKGEFVDTLLQIVALDDVVCLLAFSIVTAMINGNAAGGFSAHDLLIPVAYNLLVIVLGIFCGYFLSRLLIPARSKDNRLILAIAMLLGLSGICAAIDISPLLSCMVFGAVYINLTRDKKLFRQINSFTPPVMSVFFIVSGMNLDLNALKTVGAIGVSYFVIRIVGKYMGTYLSCLFTKTSRQIRNYMGFALIPQAGVAIGLAFLGQRMLPPETGNMMLTIILSSSVLYEMVGPVSAKAALVLSGSIPFGKRPEEGDGLPEAAEGLPESENGENSEEVQPEEEQNVSEDGLSEFRGEAEERALSQSWGKEAAEAESAADFSAGSELSEKEDSPQKDAEEKKNPMEEKDAAEKKESEEKGSAKTQEETQEQEDEEAQWGIAALPETVEVKTAEDIAAEGTTVVEDSVVSEAEEALTSEEEAVPVPGRKPEASDSRTGERGAETEDREKEKTGEETREKPEASSASGKGKERRKKKTGKEGIKEDKSDKKEKSAGKKRRQEEPDVENEETLREEEPGEKEILRQLMDPELMEEPEEQEEEDHAVLPELREYSKGVEERDVYDIEREVKPQKNKKKKKGKKADGKVRKE